MFLKKWSGVGLGRLKCFFTSTGQPVEEYFYLFIYHKPIGIKKRGVIYSTIIKEYPGNNPKDPITPIDIDEDGLITVDIDGGEYYVDLDQVEKIEY